MGEENVVAEKGGVRKGRGNRNQGTSAHWVGWQIVQVAPTISAANQWAGEVERGRREDIA
jgi:hypothetical protein